MLLPELIVEMTLDPFDGPPPKTLVIDGGWTEEEAVLAFRRKLRELVRDLDEMARDA